MAYPTPAVLLLGVAAGNCPNSETVGLGARLLPGRGGSLGVDAEGADEVLPLRDDIGGGRGKDALVILRSGEPGALECCMTAWANMGWVSLSPLVSSMCCEVDAGLDVRRRSPPGANSPPALTGGANGLVRPEAGAEMLSLSSCGAIDLLRGLSS